MRVFKQYIFSVALFCAAQVSGLAQAEEVLSHYRIVAPADKTMQAIADRFEVLKRDGKNFEVLVPIERVAELTSLDPSAVLIARDVNAYIKSLGKHSNILSEYRDFDEVTSHIQEIANAHPEIAKLETYGQSAQGRPLYVLKISDNVASDEEGEPRLMLDAATHGDELITTEVLLHLLDEVVNGYGKDDRLTAMVNNTAMYFVPVVNPDGFIHRDRYDSGVDPNRDFPWPEQPERNPVASTKGVMELAAKHQFAGSVDIHAYGGMVMHPWAYTYDPVTNHDDLQKMDELTTRMAEENRYAHGPISEVIYVAKGSSADYYYWKYNTVALAIEVGDSKVPHPSEISAKVDESREMIWRFVENFY